MFSAYRIFKTIIDLCIKKKKFVFYSEGKFYNFHYYEFLTLLAEKCNKKIHYLTSDPDDLIFEGHENIDTIYIGDGILKFIVLSTIKCDFFITTLTDIGKNILKSANCKNYIYFFHSFASTNQIYRFEAFKHYDHILCVGKYHFEEIKEFEKKFKFPSKKIIKCGYFYLDYLLSNSSLILKEKNQILFAPSWNYKKKNLFNDFGEKIIESILQLNFKLIFRPHPEILKRCEKKFNGIIKRFKNKNNFSVDLSKCPKKSLEKSEILITDNSTISMEFLFVFRRPTIYINYQEKIHNINFKKSDIVPFEKKVKMKFGTEIDAVNLHTLQNVIKKVQKKRLSKLYVEDFLKKNVFNIGNSAKIASKFLNDLS